MKIAIVGDVHMHFKGLAYIVRTHSPDVILQCGDFGYWPKDNNYNIDYCKNGQTKIYFCDGNHEDHESLRSLTSNEIHPNIYYQPRGSILKLGDYNILFMVVLIRLINHKELLGMIGSLKKIYQKEIFIIYQMRELILLFLILLR